MSPLEVNLACTVTAQRRTVELRRCLNALGRFFMPIYVSVDGGESESPDVYEIAQEVEYYRYNASPFGLWGNPNNASATYDWAFGSEDYNAVIAIEDDCVLAPDALALCLWFLTDAQEQGYYMFLSLANCNRPDACLGRETDIVESTCIDSPWAWCFTRRMWEERLRPQWNWRKDPPVGWDWSLSSSMEKHGWKSLCPVLPRAKNIGRDLGANGGAEIFDQTLALAAFSDGSWGNDYRIVK